MALTEAPANTASTTPLENETTKASKSSLLRKKVLVVDDEESILELVTDTLGARGCLVDRASSSEHALELSIRNSYEVILCDLNLESTSGKVASGFDLHDRIMEVSAVRRGPQPFFIFMTGDLVDAAIGEHTGREHNRFLQKPFRIADLLAMLNELPAPAVLQSKNSSN